MPTRWEIYKDRWKDGCGSDLCKEANRICPPRGTIPCDILFVGEAPSIAADVVGQVFTGEIRAVMEDIIVKARAEAYKHAFTNIVGCVPRDLEDRAKVIPPPVEAIQSCHQRLLDFVLLSQPKLIVAVGWHAQQTLDSMRSAGEFDAPIAGIIHPGHILRKRPYGGFEFGRAVAALSKAVAEHLRKIQ